MTSDESSRLTTAGAQRTRSTRDAAEGDVLDVGEHERGEHERGEPMRGDCARQSSQRGGLGRGSPQRSELARGGGSGRSAGWLRRARGVLERALGSGGESVASSSPAPAQLSVARAIGGMFRVGRGVAHGVAHGVARRAFADLLDALYPPRCALCPAAGSDGPWCDEHRLPQAPEGERCGRCAARLPAALAGERVCAGCRRRSPRIARTLVLADYRAQPIRPWLLAFKHGGRTDLAVPLAAALGAHVARSLAWPDDGVARLLCPIPLHPWRRLERGYDQALLLARALADELDTPCDTLLTRSRATAVQGAAGARSRASNVRGAFALRSRGWRPSFSGGGAARVRAELARFDEIWLVDDVVTSGSTLREAARALRRGGARRVCALALARADGAALDAEEMSLSPLDEADA